MLQHFQEFIATYGDAAIFVLVFCGIVGIPAPEESMLVFVGLAASQGTLKLWSALIAAFSGSLTGMLAAYILGAVLGHRILVKIGKMIGISEKKWDKATTAFKKRALWAVAFGFFIPGIRQLNPYLSGISRLRFPLYFLSSAAGALSWTTTFLLIGYFVGDRFVKLLTLSPLAIGIGCSIILAGFVLFVFIQVLLLRRQAE